MVVVHRVTELQNYITISHALLHISLQVSLKLEGETGMCARCPFVMNFLNRSR